MYWYCFLRLLITPMRFANFGKLLGYSTTPPGTFSYADILLKDPELKHLVGRPTISFSHPWQDELGKVIKPIAQLGADEFTWFDRAVLDEHATQSFTQDW